MNTNRIIEGSTGKLQKLCERIVEEKREKKEVFLMAGKMSERNFLKRFVPNTREHLQSLPGSEKIKFVSTTMPEGEKSSLSTKGKAQITY